MKHLNGLYAITDESLMPAETFEDRAEAALSAGVRIIQYRNKSSDREQKYQQVKALKQLCKKHETLLIINDDLELAYEVDADGVHIGKDDSSLQQARQQLGQDKIIGVSCYNRLELAQAAIEAGADYIAFGSFFASAIKPDAPVATQQLISHIKRESSVPVCCIGGIRADNCQPLIDAGADMLAVISEIFAHPTPADIYAATARFGPFFQPRA